MVLHSAFAFTIRVVLLMSVRGYHLPYLLLALLCLMLAWLPEPLQQLLQYQRDAIGQGQLWRLLSGHLLHSNNWHLVMNLGALLLMLMLHQLYYSLHSFALLLVSGCVGISVLLYLFSPDIQIYVGLSGWLHCFITAGALLDIKHKIQSGWLILLGVIAKVAYEQWQGPDAELATLIDANVAIDAQRNHHNARRAILSMVMLRALPSSPYAARPGTCTKLK